MDVLIEILSYIDIKDYYLIAPVCKKWSEAIETLKRRDFLKKIPEFLLPKKLQYIYVKEYDNLVLTQKYDFECYVYPYTWSYYTLYRIQEADTIIEIGKWQGKTIFETLYPNFYKQLFQKIYFCEICKINKIIKKCVCQTTIAKLHMPLDFQHSTIGLYVKSGKMEFVRNRLKLDHLTDLNIKENRHYDWKSIPLLLTVAKHFPIIYLNL